MMNHAPHGFRWLAPALASLFLAAALPAQGQGVELKGAVQVEQAIEADGRTTVQLAEPQTVVPGDRLLFTTNYENKGPDAASDIVITNAVPQAVEFIETGSAAPGLVSVDGGATWGQLDALSVSDSDGQRRPAAPADVTHIRWTVPSIVPGSAGTVSYRGIVR